VNITGTMDNSGGTLALSAATGDFTLNGGRVNGGTIAGADGAQLVVTSNGNNTLFSFFIPHT
jgi:outer membrane protein assembly factor BamB